MAKYRDEVELLLSARNEQVQALRQADGQARALAQRQDAEGRKQARRHFPRVGTEFRRILRHCNCVQIDDAINAFVLALHRCPILDGTKIVTEVEVSGGLDTGKNAFH